MLQYRLPMVFTMKFPSAAQPGGLNNSNPANFFTFGAAASATAAPGGRGIADGRAW